MAAVSDLYCSPLSVSVVEQLEDNAASHRHTDRNVTLMPSQRLTRFLCAGRALGLEGSSLCRANVPQSGSSSSKEGTCSPFKGSQEPFMYVLLSNMHTSPSAIKGITAARVPRLQIRLTGRNHEPLQGPEHNMRAQ